MKGMILAAGLGTRLKPFTNQHPKALAMINGKSLLQRNIEYLLSFGVQDIIINIHHFVEQIAEVIESNNGYGAQIFLSDERDELLETGGGLKKVEWFFSDNKPFVLMNVDVLTDMDLNAMIEYHKATGAIATLAVTRRETSRYFLFDEEAKLSGWKNMKTGEEIISRQAEKYVPMAFSGIHILSPDIFPPLNSFPRDGVEPVQKFSITNAYLEVCKSQPVVAYDHSCTKFIDVGKPESIAKAEEMFR